MRRHRFQETEIGRVEEWCSEEENTVFDLQCPDSLSIAASHIGEDIFGLRKHLLCGFGCLRRGRSSLSNTAQGPSPVRGQFHG